MIVKVDDDACIGCGICVGACPEDVLVVKDGTAYAADPSDCIGCKACEDSCPVEAIEVKDVEVIEISEQDG